MKIYHIPQLGPGEYVKKAIEFMKKHPSANIDARLVTDFDPCREDGTPPASEIINLPDADDVNADNFAKACKSSAEYSAESGVLHIWIDPYQYQNTKLANKSEIPPALASALGSRPNIGVLNACKRINRAFENNGMKLGDGTRGTIRVNIWIQPLKTTMPSSPSTHSNLIIWGRIKA